MTVRSHKDGALKLVRHVGKNCNRITKGGNIMRQKYINSGLKLLAIIGLLSVVVFAQGGGRRNDLSERRWD